MSESAGLQRAQAETSPSTDDPLFRPFRHGRLNLKSRIVMAPMGRAVTQEGVPSPDYPAYYARRIAGGAGMAISESTRIEDPAAGHDDFTPDFFGETALAVWRRMAEAVRAEGGAMIPQLWHTGMQRAPSQRDPALRPVGPSGVWLPPAGSEGVPALEGEVLDDRRIDAIIGAYAAAAAQARALGFDGVEVHMAHGYLIDQFLWERTNLRADRYGGAAVDRTRLAVDVLREVRKAIGPDFCLMVRISQFKMTDYSARLAESPQALEALLAPLVDAGVDIFDCSQRRFWEPEFSGDDRNLAGWVKKLTGRPTITVGSVGLETQFALATLAEAAPVSTARLDQLRTMLDRGDFDLVAVGRAMLSDAEWANKVRDGRHDEIVPYDVSALAALN